METEKILQAAPAAEAAPAAAETTATETAATATATAAVETAATETMADYKQELEASFRKIAVGDILKGTVIAVSEAEVTLDLNYYSQGIVLAADMSKDPHFKLMDDVRTGEEIEASVVMLDDGQGNIRLSRVEANQILAWDRLTKYKEEARNFELRVSGITKGGVICYMEDIRGFVPASQLSLSYVEDYNPWLSKFIKVRVITVDKSKEKLVLSAKAILQEEREAERARKVSMIIPGSVLSGKVETLTDFGAFVDLGDGISGLVHVSQIAQTRIKNAAEVLKVGEEVKVKVLKVNEGKISLSIKALEEGQPVEKIEEYKYESEGELTTSLGSFFENLKL